MAKPQSNWQHSLTVHLVITGAAKAVEWYQKAFNAELLSTSPMPDGRLMHAELRLGDSLLMLADTFPDMGQKSPKELGGSGVVINYYTDDCDKIWNQAVAAGATVRFPLDNQFWEDRYGQIVDPFGHIWAIGKHLEEVPPDELARRAKEAMAHMGSGHS